MKRIVAACLTQTIHFTSKEVNDIEYAKRKIQEEIRRYKMRMDRDRTRYKIISEEVLEDGSVMLEIVKEYTSTKSVGNYLD